MQTSYPIFESGQVLTSKHLNDLVEYLEPMDRLTRNKLHGIGVVCGLQVSIDRANNLVRVSRGCAVTSEGYLIFQENREFSHVRRYELPVPKLDQATQEQIDAAKYAPFINDNGQQFPMEELLPPGFTPEPGKPAPEPIASNDFGDKVVLLYLERNLEALRNCDVDDCSDKGLEMEFTLRTLWVDRRVARELVKRESTLIERPADRHDHPRYDLRALRIEKINPAVSKVDSFGTLLNRIQAVAVDLAPSLKNGLQASYEAYGYMVKDLFPALDFPFDNAGYFERVLVHTEKNLPWIIYLYAYLKDLVDSHNEFLDAAGKLDAECCPDEHRFPRHVLLGLVPEDNPFPAFEAELGAGDFENFNPLVANTGQAPQTRPARFRHHFIPSTLFERGEEQLQEVRSLYVRTVLLAYRFFLDDIKSRSLRITPSKDGDFRLSEKAIPFYYALESNKQDDDLVLNWSFHKTTRNQLHQLYSYRYINLINHPLRERMDGHNFYRIEGIVGKPLANVMRDIANQRRRLGLDFAIEPVFISAAVLGGDESERLEADALKRARGALLKMLRCRFSDLNLVFLVMTSSIFNYLLPVIAALSQLDPGKLIADPTDDGSPATDGLVATPLLTLLGGTSARHLQPKLSGTILNTLRPEVYVKGQLTEKLKPTNDPKTSVGMLYTVVKDATDSGDLFDRVEEFARDLAPAAGLTDELVANIYRPVSLLARAEEILELVKIDSIVDFDFDLFESRYKGFAEAYRKFVEAAAKAKDKPGSKTARARQVVIDNFNALAGSGASGLIASLADEFETRLDQVLDELRIENYARKHPGMLHKGGVPAGGTLILLYTHRDNLGNQITDKAAEKQLREKHKAVRTNFSFDGNILGDAVSVDLREVLGESRQAANPLESEFVVLADFCVPYYCCDHECVEEQRIPPRRPGGSRPVLGIEGVLLDSVMVNEVFLGSLADAGGRTDSGGQGSGNVANGGVIANPPVP